MPAKRRVNPNSACSAAFGETAFSTLTSSCRICIFGVPYDAASVTGGGSHSAPAAIRFASQEFSPLFRSGQARRTRVLNCATGAFIRRPLNAVDLGDLQLPRSKTPTAIGDDIKVVVRSIRSKKAFPIVIGGDHSLTYYAVKGASSRSKSLIHFDAHLDNAKPRQPGIVDNASVVGALLEDEIVRSAISIGLRGFVPRQVTKHSQRHRIISVSDLRQSGPNGILSAIPDKEEYWLTFDLDVLDPSVAGGTNTPVPGGLQFHEAQASLATILQTRRVIGCDIVELAPEKDLNMHTARAAAHILLGIIAEMHAFHDDTYRPAHSSRPA